MPARGGRCHRHPERNASRRPRASRRGREAGMTDIRMARSLTIVVTLAGLLVASHHAASDCIAGDCDGAGSDSHAGGAGCKRPFARICSRCGEKVCITLASPAKETKTCWDVECTEVCIPAVRFPWHGCPKARCDEHLSTPLPRCGKVRCVRKLKAVEYECDTCQYEQRVVCRCPNCGPVPHADCVPPPAPISAENGPASRPQTRTDTAAPQTRTDSAAPPASPKVEAKAPWSDRILPGLVRRKPRSARQPESVEGGLSRHIGHSAAASRPAE